MDGPLLGSFGADGPSLGGGAARWGPIVSEMGTGVRRLGPEGTAGVQAWSWGPLDRALHPLCSWQLELHLV